MRSSKFIQKNPNRADKRSIAKEFGIKGGGRVWLKTLLKQLVSAMAC